jgi:AcrR family transcriptional regulator
MPATPLRLTQPAPAPGDVSDGRALRSVRTREKIAVALLDLIQGGNLSPTSEDVALHAGVGHRTVFRHFEDMESLFAELHARVSAFAAPALNAPLSGATTAERIDALIARRSEVFEHLTPFYLAGESRLAASPTLQRFRAQFAEQQRAQLVRIVPELASDAARASAADVIASMDGWLRLRRTQRLSLTEARAAVAAALAALARS